MDTSKRLTVLLALLCIAVVTYFVLNTFLLLSTYTSSSQQPALKTTQNESAQAETPQLQVNMIYPLVNFWITSQGFKASGIIEQNLNNIFLKTKFEAEVDTSEYGKISRITFLPGSLRGSGLSFTLNGKTLNNVYGFAQWPQILCDEKIKTEEDCLKSKPDDIPPIVFFINVPQMEKSSYAKFAISKSTDGPKSPFFLQKFMVYEEAQNDYLSQSENCGLGYYYDKDFLAVPPVGDITGYRVLFPKSQTDNKNSQRTVYIMFDGELFDLIIPPAYVLMNYESAETGKVDKESFVNYKPYHNLYLPMDLLYYKKGEKANVLKGVDSYGTGQYFEYVPINRHDLKPLPGYFKRETTGSSSCDG